jgi:hypothetical protein
MRKCLYLLPVCLLFSCREAELLPARREAGQRDIGLIRVLTSDYETLRKQCEAASRAATAGRGTTRVQLIAVGKQDYCIRFAGGLDGFHQLVYSLRFPGSGLKPQRNYKAWWLPERERMLLPGDKPGCILIAEPNGEVFRFPVTAKSISQKNLPDVQHGAPDIRPDTLARFVCITFD